MRALGGDPWDLDNSILLHPQCHLNQHWSAFKRLSLAVVPRRTVAFAIHLMGEDAARLYLARRYVNP